MSSFLSFILTILFLVVIFALGLYLIFLKLTGLRLMDYFPIYRENRLKMIFIILSVISALLINWLIMENFSFLAELIHPIASIWIFFALIYLLLRFLFLKKVPLSNYEKKVIGNMSAIAIILELLKIIKYINEHNIASPITVALVFFIPVVVFLIAGIFYETHKNFKY